MATRVQLDPSGLRVSKPGSDANGGPAGLLLDTAIRYGQILDHLYVAVNRVKYTGPNAGYAAAISEGIEYCDCTFYYGPYPEIPDVRCAGLVDNRYEVPAIEYNGTSTIAKWRVTYTPGAGSCYVRFDRSSGAAGYKPIMPHQAMLIVYRKPRFS